jgi:hypothetical protein
VPGSKGNTFKALTDKGLYSSSSSSNSSSSTTEHLLKDLAHSSSSSPMHGAFAQGYSAANQPLPGGQALGAGPFQAPRVHQFLGAPATGYPPPNAGHGALQGFGAGLAALGALNIARLRDLAAVFQPQAPMAAPPAMRPGLSFEASEIWRAMANNVPTCLPLGKTDYALTANGQVALVRRLGKDEAFLAESLEESRSRWARLEAEFCGNVKEPNFLMIRDGMQGMELALRTPLTDAARDALVSSWRRLSLRVRTLRLAAMGLTDAARRQDQVLVVNDDKELAAIVAKEGNRRQGQGQGSGQRPRSGQRGNMRQSPPLRRRSRSRSLRRSPRRDERGSRDRREGFRKYEATSNSGVCDACGGFGNYAKDCRMPCCPRK